MAKCIISRKGVVPIRRLTVCIDDQTVYLRGNQYHEISLPKGTYNLHLKIDWWKTNSVLIVDSDEIIIEIRHYLPDLFYFVGLLITIGLFIPTFLSIINPLYYSAFLLMFFGVYLFYFFTKRKYYFNYSLRKS